MYLLRSLIIGLLLATPAHALMLDKPLADPQQEQQAQTLFHALRCVVCEGESLAESDATFAIQMRGEIRRMLVQGKSPAEVKNYFTARYGERMLQRPPFVPHTWLLWLAPLLFAIIAGLLLRPRKRGLHD